MTKNQPKIAQKIDQKMGYPIGPWRPKLGYPIDQNWGTPSALVVLNFVPFFSSDLAASWALSRASGDQLGAVLGRLGASWSRPGTASERSWAVPGASWGVLEHLGDVLGASWSILEAFRDNFHEQLRFLIDFCSQFRPPKPKKSLIFHWFYKHF